MMKCPHSDCVGEVRVMHSYDVTGSSRTVDGVCDKCKRRVVGVHVYQAKEFVGMGAYALAQKMKKDKAMAEQAKRSPF